MVDFPASALGSDADPDPRGKPRFEGEVEGLKLGQQGNLPEVVLPHWGEAPGEHQELRLHCSDSTSSGALRASVWGPDLPLGVVRV